MGTPAAPSDSTSRYTVRTDTSSSSANACAVIRPRFCNNSSRDSSRLARIRPVCRYLTEDVSFYREAGRMSIPEQHLFILAEQAISGVFEQVGQSERDGWERPIAAEGAMSGGTARDVVTAHARDNQWVGHTLAGGTIEDGKPLFPEQPLADLEPAKLLAGWREI